jgi:hypothetical protein
MDILAMSGILSYALVFYVCGSFITFTYITKRAIAFSDSSADFTSISVAALLWPYFLIYKKLYDKEG